MRTEIWKTAIVNGEPWKNYQVSNFGQILSLNYHRSGRAKLMNPWKDKDGYLKIGLRKDGKQKHFYVHRLVVETFIPNPNNLPEVNHKDEDKTNNFVGTPENDYKDGNLEWCTREYNTNYGTRNERSAKTKSKPVLQFTLDGILVKEWPSTKECGRNGFHSSAVSRCCNGKQPHYKGYIWQYK